MFFGRKKPESQTTDTLYTLFDEMAKKPHLLIAGATGSGKSVVENGILYNLFHETPNVVQFIMIDPKKVELARYKDFPHVIRYANEPKSILAALQYAEQIVDSRYREMAKKRLLEYDGSDVYVVIDELSYLMTCQKNEALPILQKIGMIARAAHVHMLACTQSVNATILPTTLTCNFDSRIALKTSTAQQSRMIIGVNGCESFPHPPTEHKAYCFFMSGSELTLYDIPKYSDNDYNRLIAHWTKGKKAA